MKIKKSNILEVSARNANARTNSDKKLDGVIVWKQFEDLVVPRLKFSLFDRAAYSHLLRHSRLEGKTEIRFSIGWLARGACFSTWAARKAVRSLIAKGAVRLVERSTSGHTVEVRLPEEMPTVRASQVQAEKAERPRSEADLEKLNFLETRELREAIHAREKGLCFYCMRKLTPTTRCLDHVVPRVHGGGNSYRNLVSACAECNAKKREQSAEDFLRWLYREGSLGTADLKGRLRALEVLAAGKLRPTLPGHEKVKIPGANPHLG